MSDPLRDALALAIHAMRAPLDDWKGELESKALAAAHAALDAPMQEPAGWFESPHGAFRANPLYRFDFPSALLAWQIPLYVVQLTAPDRADDLALAREYMTGYSDGKKWALGAVERDKTAQVFPPSLKGNR